MIILLTALCLCILARPVYTQETPQTEETPTESCGNNTEEICEAVNSTEFSTASAVIEVTSEITKTPVTSKKPKTTTAKSVTKKPSSAPNNTALQPYHGCTCDLTRGDCEINCCCDVDCSTEQRAVFTHCHSISQPVDSDYCFPSHLLYHNNTDYQTVETEPGVLCIVHHNTLASTDFVDAPVITTVAALEKKLGGRRYYSWPNPPLSTSLFDTDTTYGSGSPIWIAYNSTITQLVLPASTGYSTICHSTTVSQYFEETVSSCTKPIRTKFDCLTSTEINFTVICSPHIFNFTHPQECTEEICLPVHQYICSTTCTEGIITHPLYNDSSNTCQNIIESVEYKLYHNGSQGIVDVKAFYRLRNITVHDGQLFHKRYRISYVWAGSTNKPVLRRSGWPGYVFGKPVISARRTTKAVTFNVSTPDWVNVGVSENSGYCIKRHTVLFGENLQTQCLLTVNGTCKQIQQQIWQELIGTATLSDLLISSYGDPRLEDEHAWVPLLVAELPLLPALTTAVNIVIVHSLVGPVASPQGKIIAAYINTVPSTVTCDLNHTTVLVQTSVQFIDKTAPAITKFAQPPAYEIKLPQDFSYPFLSISNRNYINYEVFVLTIVLVIPT